MARNRDRRKLRKRDRRDSLTRALNRIEASPEWVQPVLIAPIMLAHVILLRGGIVLIPLALYFILVGRGGEVLDAVGMFALIFAGSAVGGLVYSLLGRPLRTIPVVGRYLAGLVSITPYVAAIGAVLNVARMGADSFFAPWGKPVIVACILSVLAFGLIIGHFWFVDDPSATEDASV